MLYTVAMAEASGDPDLPAHVRALWESRERPRRGPKPGLSLDRIVRAAIAIADADGIGAVSMGRVAEAVGYTTMALYRYVSSKDELYAGMMQAVAEEAPLPPGPGEDWRASLELWTREQFATLRRHPWMTQVAVEAQPLIPGQLAWLDWGLRALSGTSLSEGDKVQIALLLLTYVLSEARFSFEVGDEDPAATGIYGRMLRRLVDPQRWPGLHRSIEAGVFDGPTGYSEVEFGFGLHRVLDGIEAYIRSRHAD